MSETTHSQITYSVLEEALAGSALRTLEQAYVLEDRSAIPAFIKRNGLLELLLEARGRSPLLLARRQ